MSDRNIFDETPGEAATALESNETPMELISQALVVDAKAAIVYMQRAMFYMREGMFDAMESVLDAGIAVVPDNGVLLLMRKDFENYRTSELSGD